MVYAQKAMLSSVDRRTGSSVQSGLCLGTACCQGVTATLVHGTEVHPACFCSSENMGPEAGVPGFECNSASSWL